VVDSRSLDVLDPPAWGAAPSDATYVIQQCHELRTKPIDDFTIEDLRLLIGQKVALAHLVPQAITVLENNPLAAGDFYPGDLLQAVLRIDGEYWQQHQDQLLGVHGVVDALVSAVDDLAEPIESFRRLTQP
jgi:hypothetical protein